MLKPDSRHDVVFLLDVDNTLLDNDRFKADLDERLLRDFGAEGRDRCWACHESETISKASPRSARSPQWRVLVRRCFARRGAR